MRMRAIVLFGILVNERRTLIHLVDVLHPDWIAQRKVFLLLFHELKQHEVTGRNVRHRRVNRLSKKKKSSIAKNQ